MMHKTRGLLATKQIANGRVKISGLGIMYAVLKYYFLISERSFSSYSWYYTKEI